MSEQKTIPLCSPGALKLQFRRTYGSESLTFEPADGLNVHFHAVAQRVPRRPKRDERSRIEFFLSFSASSSSSSRREAARRRWGKEFKPESAIEVKSVRWHCSGHELNMQRCWRTVAGSRTEAWAKLCPRAACRTETPLKLLREPAVRPSLISSIFTSITLINGFPQTPSMHCAHNLICAAIQTDGVTISPVYMQHPRGSSAGNLGAFRVDEWHLKRKSRGVLIRTRLSAVSCELKSGPTEATPTNTALVLMPSG
ncbi:hypothetical protein DNTS_016351 [Danionella cerebrum]|uniref:Uncharacterized protein n=1 Tax=Danionella cerebrum TaxID=2873325 RepID=A0A553MZD5_9TELE|nr:hypothetical protein DNTS_016351 [Danionella translucida]